MTEKDRVKKMFDESPELQKIVLDLLQGYIRQNNFNLKLKTESEREKELKSIIKVNNELVEKLVDDILFIETQLSYLRTLPFIKIDKLDSTRQKATPASKLYKELVQQYVNVVKALARCTGQDIEEDDSPLRLWAIEYKKNKEV